jgi:transposase
LPCRKQRPVAIWLDTLPHKERVQLVVIDMWRPYRDLIRTFLPNAAIVVDKFHIVRMANQALDRVRNDVRREGTTVKSRKNPRANRFLMQTGRRNLDPMESMRLDGMLANSPLFKAAWEAKERFYDVWQAGARADAERLYDEWQASIDPSVSHAFAKLVTSVTNWRNEIFAYFDYPVTNAYTEAVNGLIKIANRAGRGYSFDTIRAKALLRQPGPHKACGCCKGEFPVSAFRIHQMKYWVDGKTYPFEMCTNCHLVFNTAPKELMDAMYHTLSTWKSD